MGVKMLQCFPFYRRCKERCKSKQCPPAAGEERLASHRANQPAMSQRHQIMPDFLSLSDGLTVPPEEMKPRLCSNTSCSSDGDSAGSLNRNSQIYFSTKARLSFRHQLDSNINAVDATYWGGLQRRETESSVIVSCCFVLLGAWGWNLGAVTDDKHDCWHISDGIRSSCAQLQFTFWPILLLATCEKTLSITINPRGLGCLCMTTRTCCTFSNQKVHYFWEVLFLLFLFF